MVTVRIKAPGGERVRVTAKDIETATKITGGEVIFPIDPEEFFEGSGPRTFYSVEHEVSS